MPRSARRRSAPSSPIKSRGPPSSPPKTRKGLRARSREPSSTSGVAKRNYAQHQLTSVHEEATNALNRPAPIPRDLTHEKWPAHDEDISNNGSFQRTKSIRASVYDDIEPTELRIESMIKNLSGLDIRADELLSQLDLYSTSQLLDRLSDRESAAWREFSEDAAKLERDRQYYNNDADIVDIEWLSQRLTARKLPAAGAEHVYMKANLALFAYRLLEGHPVEVHNLLVILTSVQTFPEAFTRRHNPQSSSLKRDREFERRTLLLGFGIMTQCFIFNARRLLDKGDFNVSTALKDIFLTNGTAARDISLEGISPGEEDAYINMVKSTMSEVNRTISSTDDLAAGLEALENKYPWTTFVVHALDWIRLRAVQLENTIKRAGGVRAIKNSLRQAMKAAPASKPSHRKSRLSKTDQQFIGNVTLLRQMDEFLNARDTDSQESQNEDGKDQPEDEALNGKQEIAESGVIPSQSSRILREIIPESPQTEQQARDPTLVSQSQEAEAFQPDLINGDEPIQEEEHGRERSPSEISTIRPTQETKVVLDIISRQAKESNKENNPSLGQHQTSGHREDAVDVNPSAAGPAVAKGKGKGKRPRRGAEDEESDEDDFETNIRQVKRARPFTEDKKDVSDAQVQAQREGSGMFFPEGDADTETTEPDAEQSIPQSTHNPPREIKTAQELRPGPSSTQPIPSRSTTTSTRTPAPLQPPSSTAPPVSSYDHYRVIKALARVNTFTAAATAAAVADPSTSRSAQHLPLPRAPQQRRAWTDAETERLLWLMRRYGCSWSTIKKADEQMVNPKLLDRSQVQLKDKARNIKMDYLKAERELPDEFINVTISRAQKDSLREMNIAVPGDEFEFDFE